MPLMRVKYISPSTILGIWRLDEPESYFQPQLDNYVVDPEQLNLISHDGRRKEWIAGRFLIYQLAKLMMLEFNGVYSDEFGKPHLYKTSGHISISHAHPYVTAMIDTKHSCGVDIERIRPKLVKLAPKFLSEVEQAQSKNKEANLAVSWAAKEALYKLHGRKRLIFKENLELKSIPFDQQKGDFMGIIKEKNSVQTIKMKFQRDQDFVLVFSIS